MHPLKVAAIVAVVAVLAFFAVKYGYTPAPQRGAPSSSQHG